MSRVTNTLEALQDAIGRVPKIGSVIWPERAVNPEPWMRRGDTWESISEFAGDAGELQCACGDGFTVLRLGGGEE